MLREMSCIFIGAYAVVVIVALWRLSQGQAAFEAYTAYAQNTAGFAFAVLAMLFALYHTFTWFQVTPKAMPLVLAGKRVPGPVIVLGHWAGFIAASAIFWLLVAG
jgi:fumarate reductase subunit C